MQIWRKFWNILFYENREQLEQSKEDFKFLRKIIEDERVFWFTVFKNRTKFETETLTQAELRIPNHKFIWIKIKKNLKLKIHQYNTFWNEKDDSCHYLLMMNQTKILFYPSFNKSKRKALEIKLTIEEYHLMQLILIWNLP